MSQSSFVISGLRSMTVTALMLCAWGVGNALASADDAADREMPTFERALPDHMFKCVRDAQCVVVQGWCATFSINKVHLAAYNQLPIDPNGKSEGCPPGWLPPLPKAVCMAKRCTVVNAGLP